VLIVAQIALTAALLVGVGLLLRSSQRLLAEDVGFNRNQLAISAIADLPHVEGGASAEPRPTRLRSPPRASSSSACGALPGVSAVGLGSLAPFGWSMSVSNFALPGQEDTDPSTQPVANRAFVNADYFAALGTTFMRGRAFTAEEVHAGAAVAVVDAKFAQQVFGDRDALGQKFMMGVDDKSPMRALTIVGIVPTQKLHSLNEKAERPTAYQPEEMPLNGMLLVRVQSDPAALAAPVKDIFHALAPRAKLRDVVPMTERIADTLRDAVRLNALLELLGAMSLALARLASTRCWPIRCACARTNSACAWRSARRVRAC
jgi:hypothetical protein